MARGLTCLIWPVALMDDHRVSVKAVFDMPHLLRTRQQ